MPRCSTSAASWSANWPRRRRRSHCGGGGAAAQAADEEIGGVKFSGQVIDGLDAKDLRGLLDQAKARMGSGVAVAIAVNDGKASIAAAVTDDLTARINAVDLVRAGVEALGGKGGGGRPDMAQGGGPDWQQGSRGDCGGEGSAGRITRSQPLPVHVQRQRT